MKVTKKWPGIVLLFSREFATANAKIRFQQFRLQRMVHPLIERLSLFEPLHRVVRARHKRTGRSQSRRASPANTLGSAQGCCSHRAHVVVAAARAESATDFNCRFNAPA
ncbi:hypothetical protein XAP6164_1960002 [Xanthomonas phaseoli pv. phaseoli]|nr:hypothetical protein XAP6164_1960002 [Xanthomonas phaseoli pv. phaseoli]